MSTKQITNPKYCSTKDMTVYSTGEAASSLILNSLYAFAMIYYTDALGLNPALAGLAMTISVIWDAVTDPLMGHISDNTKSKLGRRHPYILVGGLAMLGTFYMLWQVPDFFKSDTTILFWYLVVMNLLLRTAFTVFVVPYTALGFEICTDYTGRSKLQGIRMAFNMAANLCGPALAWTVFFSNNEPIRATNVAQNYVNMGTVFTLVCLVIVLFIFFSTLKHVKDSRKSNFSGNSIKAFLEDYKTIILDGHSRWVFGFIAIVSVGIHLSASFQAYLYEHFMKFTGYEKTIAHGSSMVFTALGGLFASVLVRRFDKKGAVKIAVAFSVSANIILAVVFLSGFLQPGREISFMNFLIPIGFIVFTLFHSLYWFGNGVLFPIGTSMMADLSELSELKTNLNKDGSYSAMFSFALKAAMSIGTLFSGLTLTWIGFVSGKEGAQTPQVVWKLGLVTFVIGPVISLLSMAVINGYKVNKNFVEQARANSSGQ